MAQLPPDAPQPKPLDYEVPSGSRRSHWFLAGAITAVVLVLVSIFLPALQKPRIHTNSGRCAHHIRQIALAAILYANDNGGRFAETAEQLLLTQDITSEVFVCPGTNDTRATGATTEEIAANLSAGGHLSYIYCGQGHSFDSLEKVPSRSVVAVEPLSNHGDGINVAFDDAHVEWITGQAAQDILSQVQSGVRPVRWPPPGK